MCLPCGAARALCQQQRVPRHLCHAVPWPSLQRARAGCCAVLLPAVLCCCLLACHAAHRMPWLITRQPCSRQFALHGGPAAAHALDVGTNACLGSHPPCLLNPSAACRAGRVCCRTCLTVCSSWQASLWARRPRPTSLEGPRAPQALRAASLLMHAAQQHPSHLRRCQRQWHRRQRHRQQQQMAAVHPLDRLLPVWLRSLE